MNGKLPENIKICNLKKNNKYMVQFYGVFKKFYISSSSVDSWSVALWFYVDTKLSDNIIKYNLF